MTDIKETINTTSDGQWCVKTQKKVLLAKSWGAVAPSAPPEITPLQCRGGNVSYRSGQTVSESLFSISDCIKQDILTKMHIKSSTISIMADE